MIGKAVRYIVDGKSFVSLLDGKLYTQEILYRYNIGDVLNAEDTRFLIEALKFRGPSGIRKIGSGVDHISVEKMEFGDRGFRLYRIDGSMTDFSYVKIWSRKTARLKRSATWIDFVKACRTAVIDQVCGRPGFHAHHEGIPFVEIVKRFIDDTGIDIEMVEIKGHEDGAVRVEFWDPDLRRQWAEYHAKTAKIVYLPSEIHKAAHARREYDCNT